MSCDHENLRSALKALAEETRGAEASSRVHQALRLQLHAHSRRRRITAWWPAAAAAALILGVWLGMPRNAPAPQPPTVATAQPEPAQPEPSAVGTDREVSPPQPLAATTHEPRVFRATPRTRRASRVTTGAQSVSYQPGTRALTPWYFYTGLPVSTRGQIVRIQVSDETAAQFGVLAASGTVPAQVFIGDDGVARAIRFLHQ